MSRDDTVTYDAHIRVIRHLPIASGIQHNLTDSFRTDVLSKFDIRYYNLELLYCAYYFLYKADIHNIVRENRNSRDVIIQHCKSWINSYLDSNICTPEESRLIPYFEGKYSKKSKYSQRLLVLDIVRYIDIILFTQTSDVAVPEPEVKPIELDFDKLREYTANEHMLIGSVNLGHEEATEYTDVEEDD